jgi:hypothetical protein
MSQDPVAFTLLGVPGVVVLWVLTLVAFGIFGRRAARLIGLIRRGRPENRSDQPVQRLLNVVKHVFLSRACSTSRPSGCPTS